MGKLFIGNFSNRSRNKTNSFHFFVLWYWFGYAQCSYMAQRPPFKEEETEFFLLLQFYDQTDRNVHIPKCKSWISTLIKSRHSQKSHRIIILLYFIGSANSARASSFSYGNPVIIDFVSFCRYIFPFLRLYMLNALNVLIFDCVLSPSTLSCIPPVPPCMVFPFVVNLK